MEKKCQPATIFDATMWRRERVSVTTRFPHLGPERKKCEGCHMGEKIIINQENAKQRQFNFKAPVENPSKNSKPLLLPYWLRKAGYRKKTHADTGENTQPPESNSGSLTTTLKAQKLPKWLCTLILQCCSYKNRDANRPNFSGMPRQQNGNCVNCATDLPTSIGNIMGVDISVSSA